MLRPGAGEERPKAGEKREGGGRRGKPRKLEGSSNGVGQGWATQGWGERGREGTEAGREECVPRSLPPSPFLCWLRGFAFCQKWSPKS